MIFFILQIYKIKNTRLKLESRIFHLHKIFYSATYRELASKQTFKVLLVFIDYKLISLF